MVVFRKYRHYEFINVNDGCFYPRQQPSALRKLLTGVTRQTYGQFWVEMENVLEKYNVKKIRSTSQLYYIVIFSFIRSST